MSFQHMSRRNCLRILKTGTLSNRKILITIWFTLQLISSYKCDKTYFTQQSWTILPMNIKTLILLLVVLPSAGCNRHYDGVNELKEMVKKLQKQMHKFSVYECVNGRKSKPMPKINKIVEFQLGSARYEYQQSLDDGVLSTDKYRKYRKNRIRKKFDRSMDYTKVSDRIK